MLGVASTLAMIPVGEDVGISVVWQHICERESNTQLRRLLVGREMGVKRHRSETASL
ncbi:MAG: hypothetical protein ACYTX0_37295 [Nostoc sp.]